MLIEAWAATLDDEAREVIVGVGCEIDASAELVVPHGVVDDVRHHAGKERLIADHVGITERRPNRETPSSDIVGSGVERGCGKTRQRNGVEVVNHSSLRACQDEEALEQPVRLVETFAHFRSEHGRIF